MSGPRGKADASSLSAIIPSKLIHLMYQLLIEICTRYLQCNILQADIGTSWRKVYNSLLLGESACWPADRLWWPPDRSEPRTGELSWYRSLVLTRAPCTAWSARSGGPCSPGCRGWGWRARGRRGGRRRAGRWGRHWRPSPWRRARAGRGWTWAVRSAGRGCWWWRSDPWEDRELV